MMKTRTLFEETLEPKSLLQKLQSLTSAKRFWVGYSGGLDSHVLLTLMVQAIQSLKDKDKDKDKDKCEEKDHQTNYEVGAIHVHHGLSHNANAWVEHCKTVCARLHVPLEIFFVDAEVKEGESQEEVARNARFNAMSNFIKEDECLLLAHHAEDQAETILMRLFRGAGPKGLSGMAEKMQMGHLEILRPLLSVSKDVLLQYAKTNQLQWIQDDSNHNIRFDRNYLRHEILPRLKARWPQVVRSVNRSGALCLESASNMKSIAEADWQKVLGNTARTLSVKELLKLETIRRYAVIRHWLELQQLTLPSRDHIERIDREILKAKPGAKPRLKISHYRILRFKDELMVEMDSVMS